MKTELGTKQMKNNDPEFIDLSKVNFNTDVNRSPCNIKSSKL
jgi:hypothetical protein